jgi:glycosidase
MSSFPTLQSLIYPGSILSQVLTVGETPFGFDDKVLIPYILPSANELQQIFHFELSKLDEKRNKTRFAERKWKLTELKRIVGKWQHAMFEAGTWNAIYLENHDRSFLPFPLHFSSIPSLTRDNRG